MADSPTQGPFDVPNTGVVVVDPDALPLDKPAAPDGDDRSNDLPEEPAGEGA